MKKEDIAGLLVAHNTITASREWRSLSASDELLLLVIEGILTYGDEPELLTERLIAILAEKEDDN